MDFVQFRSDAYKVITISLLVLVPRALALEDGEKVMQLHRPSPVREVHPGTWATHQVELMNPAQHPVSVVSGGYFSGNALQHYSRRAELPARSIRRLQIPVLPTANEEGAIEWNSMLYLDDGDQAGLLRASDTYIVDQQELPQTARPQAAVIGHLSAANQSRTDSLRHMMVAQQLASGQTSRVIQIDGAEVPAVYRELDSVGKIMLGTSKISDSPAILDAIRSWVHRGGRLWICLDQTGTAVVDDLFGDHVSVYPVDKSGLVDFRLKYRRGRFDSDERLVFDYPVDIIRADVSNVEVIHEVDGWPASFAMNYGDGRVVFTTLGKRAWIRERTNDDPPAPHEKNSRYLARPSMVSLIDAWREGVDTRQIDEAEFRTYLSKQTGYEIPSGTTVIIVLAAFCLAYITAGLWLHWKPLAGGEDELSVRFRARLGSEHLTVIGATLAVTFAGSIVLLGESARSGIDPAISTLEYVQIDERTSNIRSVGLTSVYSPDGDTVQLATQNGRILKQPEDASSGTIRRLMWTDYGETKTQNLQVPAGIQFYPSRQEGGLSDSVRATGTFGPQGLTGLFTSGCFRNPVDAILVGSSEHTLAVNIRPDGTFTAGTEDRLEQGTFMADAILSDQQALRQNIYRSLLQQTDNRKSLADGRLLAWTERAVTDLSDIEGFSLSHTSLVSVPLRLIPPPPETAVVVPSPLVRMEVLSSRGGGTTTAYDGRSRQWIESTAKTNLNLRFEIPAVLMPLRTTQLDLEFSIDAPGRPVKVSAGTRDALTSVSELQGPSGTYHYVLDDARQFETDVTGRFYVDVIVGPASGDGDDKTKPETSRWKINYIRMEVAGRTLHQAKHASNRTEPSVR